MRKICSGFENVQTKSFIFVLTRRDVIFFKADISIKNIWLLKLNVYYFRFDVDFKNRKLFTVWKFQNPLSERIDFWQIIQRKIIFIDRCCTEPININMI